VAGFNPVWHNTLEFKVRLPELAFVVFTVFAKNLPIAHYATPYHCIQQGEKFLAFFITFSRLNLDL